MATYEEGISLVASRPQVKGSIFIGYLSQAADCATNEKILSKKKTFS